MLNNVEGVCQTNIHLLNDNSNLYCHYFFLSFSFGRMAQLVAHSLHKREVPARFKSRAWHLTEFFFLLVYDNILLACDFYISFHSLREQSLRMLHTGAEIILLGYETIF